VVDPEGKESPSSHRGSIRSHRRACRAMELHHLPYLKQIGWRGFTDGVESGVYRVAAAGPAECCRWNGTPLAQEAYERMYDNTGRQARARNARLPLARLIEALYAAERMKHSSKIRRSPGTILHCPDCRPPRKVWASWRLRVGTLIHNYWTDGDGLPHEGEPHRCHQPQCRSIVMSVEKAAKGLIKKRAKSLRVVEYCGDGPSERTNPCLGCATHAHAGTDATHGRHRALNGEVIRRISRDAGHVLEE